MRDIKFRAWDFVNKEMLFADVYEIQDKIDDWVAWDNPRDNTENTGTSFDVMQFTGINDDDGNEIYEGDICQISGSGNLQAIICPLNGVCFGDEAVTAHDCVMEMESVSIVGNIYENPELLKGE